MAIAGRRECAGEGKDVKKLRPIMRQRCRGNQVHLSIDHDTAPRFSLLHVANHHAIETARILTTSTYDTTSAAMSNPLADYLSAIEARDAREKAHEEYINACKY